MPSLSTSRKRRSTERKRAEGWNQERNHNICSLLWEFSSLLPPFLLSLFSQPSFCPPSTSLQTGLSLWGALSFPLGWSGSFQGTLMDANAGLFQIVLQPQPLICQQASLHGLPVLRKCKSPPYRHLWKKYSQKKEVTLKKREGEKRYSIVTFGEKGVEFRPHNSDREWEEIVQK